MAFSSPNQLFLLADHIKLSLLERQRAISLNLEPTSQDGHIARSLESLREGLEGIATERTRLQEAQDASTAASLQQTEERLQSQYNDLSSQFHGYASPATTSVISQPNDPSLAADFRQASQRPNLNSSGSASLLKTSRNNKNSLRSPDLSSSAASKSVRFSDTPHVRSLNDDDDDDEAATRAALFPYRDDPAAGETASSSQQGPQAQTQSLDNQQIHAYHSRVIAEQDAALDRLGESIGRQRELSIQIGDELDGHVQMLDEADAHVERHQSRLDRAGRSLGTVARRARDNSQMTIIIVLIVILVLLIIILK